MSAQPCLLANVISGGVGSLLCLMLLSPTAVVGLLYPCIDSHLGEPHKFKREWASVMRCVAVFVGINHASAVSFRVGPDLLLWTGYGGGLEPWSDAGFPQQAIRKDLGLEIKGLGVGAPSLSWLRPHLPLSFSGPSPGERLWALGVHSWVTGRVPGCPGQMSTLSKMCVHLHRPHSPLGPGHFLVVP